MLLIEHIQSFIRRYNDRSQTFRIFEISVVLWFIFHSIKLWQSIDLIVALDPFFAKPVARFPFGFDLFVYNLSPKAFIGALVLFMALSLTALFIEMDFFVKATLWFLYINLLTCCPPLADGGTTLLATLWFFYAFIDLKSLDGSRFSIKDVFNSVLIFSMQYQIVIVYIQAALSKIRTDGWSSGVALYYILQVPEFTNPLFSDLIVKSDVLTVTLTYATILFQLVFPFAILSQKSKFVVIFLGILFHLGIASSMGLMCFGIFMTLTYLLFLTNEDLKRMRYFYSVIAKNLLKIAS